MGGLHSALNNHAQQVYDSLVSDAPRAIARVMFKSLTDPHSHRRDLRRDALVSEVARVAAAPIDTTIAVADAFRAEGRHMLMPPATVPLDATSRLDISHESLLRQWSSLSEWAREEGTNAREFDRLREEAQREREQEGELLSGRALARAQDWIKQARPTPEWAERYAPAGELDATLAFIARSEADAKRRKDEETRAAAREAHAKRQRYITVGALGGLTLALIVVIAISYLWQKAVAQQAIAEGLAKDAEAQRSFAEVQRKDAEAQRSFAEVQRKDAEAQRSFAEVLAKNEEAQRDIAEVLTQEVQQERAELYSIYLATSAEVALSRNASLAVLLARETLKKPQPNDRAIRVLRNAIANHVPSIEAPFRTATSRNYVNPAKTSWLDFSLNSSSLSSRGDLVITPSQRGAIIWSMDSGKPLTTLSGHHAGIVGSAIFSPDGRLAVTTSADHKAIVWNTSSGKPLKTLSSHADMINRAVFNRSGTQLVTLGDDRRAIVWTTGDYSELCAVKRPDEANFIVGSFSHDESLLATVTHHPTRWTAQVWNVARPGCPQEAIPLLDKSEDVRWASFSSAGSWLGVVLNNGEVIVLDGSNGWKERTRFTPEMRYQGTSDENLPPPAAWSQDGNYFAAAGGDNVVYVVPIENQIRRVGLRGHTGKITSINFGPRDDMLLTTSTDGTARLWALDSGKRVLEVLILSGHQKTVGSGAFSPTSDKVVTAGDDATVRAWTPVFSVKERELPGICTASYTADGKRIWAAGVDGAPRVTANSLEPRRPIVRPGSWVSELNLATPAPSTEQRKIETPARGFQALRMIEEPGAVPGEVSAQGVP